MENPSLGTLLTEFGEHKTSWLYSHDHDQPLLLPYNHTSAPCFDHDIAIIAPAEVINGYTGLPLPRRSTFENMELITTLSTRDLINDTIMMYSDVRALDYPLPQDIVLDRFR